jgi:hypothetical protein
MDIAALKAAALQAREFEVTLAENVTVRLRLPTRYELELHSLAKTEPGRVGAAKVLRAMLEAAFVSWSGVCASHLVPEAPAEPLAFSREAVELLLDERPDWGDRLRNVFSEALAARSADLEANRKN